MDDTSSEKRGVKVNAFKAPEEWYEIVKAIARERNSTVSSAIISLVELGVPIYAQIKGSERAIIAETVASYKRLRTIKIASATREDPRHKAKGGS